MITSFFPVVPSSDDEGSSDNEDDDKYQVWNLYRYTELNCDGQILVVLYN